MWSWQRWCRILLGLERVRRAGEYSPGRVSRIPTAGRHPTIDTNCRTRISRYPSAPCSHDKADGPGGRSRKCPPYKGYKNRSFQRNARSWNSQGNCEQILRTPLPVCVPVSPDIVRHECSGSPAPTLDFPLESDNLSDVRLLYESFTTRRSQVRSLYAPSRQVLPPQELPLRGFSFLDSR